jgi:hypothetical protein
LVTKSYEHCSKVGETQIQEMCGFNLKHEHLQRLTDARNILTREKAKKAKEI